MKLNNMNNIKEFRKKTGLKQIEFAKKLNFLQATYSNYENNARQPNVNDAIKIYELIKELGVDCQIDDVFPPSAKAA